MGRSKAVPRPSAAQPSSQDVAGAGQRPGGGRAAPSSAAEQCALCGKHVAVEEEEHIAGHCTNPACGDNVFHTQCVIEHLEKTLKASKGSAFGSKAWASVQVKLRQRPHAMLAASREQKMPQRCPSCKDGYIESAEPVKPEAARKLTHLPPPPDPLPMSPRAPRPVAAPAPRPAAQPAARPAPAAMPAAKKPVVLPQGRAAGNGSGSHGGNGAGSHGSGAGIGRSRSGGGGRGAGSSWGGTKQYVLSPLPPPTTNAWAPSSAGAAAAAASLADAERQEEERAARLRADAQAREEAFLPFSSDALDAIRAHKRHQAAAVLMEMGYEYDAASAAAEAAGGSTELAAHLLMGGALSSAHSGPIRVTDEARELLDLGSRLGLPPMEVEEALLDAEGDWRQAAAVLSSVAAAQREAAAAHHAAAMSAAPPRQRGRAAAAALPTATEGDDYGWGPGPEDYAHATQAAAGYEEEWEAAPPGSEWDTSARPTATRAAHAPHQGGYSSSQAVDDYGWPIEPEQPASAPEPGYSGDGGSWGGDDASWAGQSAQAYGAVSDGAAAPDYGWGEEDSAAAAPAPTFQPEAVHYTAAPTPVQQHSLQHLPPHMLPQQAAGSIAAPLVAAPTQAALSPFAAEYHPGGPATPAMPPAVHPVPAAQPPPAYTPAAVQAPPLPHPPGGRPAYQHPAAPAAVAPQPARAKYRPRLPYQDSAEEEVVGDLMSALGI